MKLALAWILGAAGTEFAWEIRDALEKICNVHLNDVATAVMGILIGLVLTIVFVVMPEVKKDA